MEVQENIPGWDIEGLGRLKGWLRSEMTVGESEMMVFRSNRNEEGVKVIVRVRNDSPENYEVGDIVFVGVGVRLAPPGRRIDGRPSKARVSKTEESKRKDLYQRYDLGKLFRRHAQHPLRELSEPSPDDVLFPGESLTYEAEIPMSEWPQISISVEGSLSRVHLFHVIHRLKGPE